MTRNRGRENAAANAVMELLGSMTGTALRGHLYDDGSQDRMHDFTITSETHKIALEVSTIADPARIGREHRWSRASPDGWLKVPGLTGCWLAHHEGDVEADTAIPEVRAHLPVLERLGLNFIVTDQWQEHTFTPASMRPPEREHVRALNSVGFSMLTRVNDAPETLLDECGGQVYVGRAFEFSRRVDRDLPVALVTEELHGDHASDVSKLRAAKEVTERHLWLWVEPAEGLALFRSFESEGVPEANLNVEGVDGVWLGRSPSMDTVAGYVWLRGQGWSAFSAARNERDLGPY